MSVVILLFSFVAPPLPLADSFATEFEALRRIPETRRAVLVPAWERLIVKYRKHPRVAEAMITLGHVFAQQDLDAVPPERHDAVSSLAWFRRAVQASRPGSDLWVVAQFLVAVRAMHPNPAEARAIFSEIAAKRDDSLTLIRIEHEMATVCSLEGDRDGALRHDQNVLNWYKDDPRRIPTDPDLQRELDLVMVSACHGMTQYITSFPLSKHERAAMICKVMDQQPFFVPLQQAGRKALKILDSKSEYHPRPPTPIVVPGPSAGWSNRTRLFLTVTVVGLILGLFGRFFYRRRRRLSQMGHAG